MKLNIYVGIPKPNLFISDYDFVVKRMKGELNCEQEKRQESKKKIVQKNRDLIYKHVDVSDICPDLVSHKVISHARYEIIQSAEQLRGKCHATSPLLDSIWRLHVNWFEIFLHVLRKHKYGFIADEIIKAGGMISAISTNLILIKVRCI
jgi:hypothetical protein